MCKTILVDDLIASMSKSIIEKAMASVIHHFDFSIKDHSILDLKTVMELNDLSQKDPITKPCGLFITVNTKQNANTLMGIIAFVVKSLVNSGYLKQDRIREMYFSRSSSIEEKVDVYLVELSD